MTMQSLRSAGCELRLTDASRRSGPSLAHVLAADSFKLLPCRCLTALVLVAGMFVVGMPLPAKAASDEAAASHSVQPPTRPPLSRLPLLVEAWESWPLSDHTVERPIGGATSADAEEEAAVSAADQERLLADILIGGLVVPNTDRDGSRNGWTESRWVSAGAVQQATAGGQQRRGVLFWTAVGAGVGVGAGLIYMAANPDCRYKESLCPLAPIMLGATGATFGFLFGLGR